MLSLAAAPYFFESVRRRSLMSTPAKFVQQLSIARLSDNLFNPYGRSQGEASAVPRQNLLHYLEQMQQTQPDWLLVGEAPGYRGCRLTGIPFTSEAILQQASQRNIFVTASNGRFMPQMTGSLGQRPRAEASATIVWTTLQDLELVPLLWNVLPFHPHIAGKPESNRTPTRAEIALGQPFLIELVGLFPTVQPVAVGQKAAQALGQWGFSAPQVRHPSHGGARQFRLELAAITGRTLRADATVRGN